MNFLAEGKTNWKYILIVVILVAITVGGVFQIAKILQKKPKTWPSATPTITPPTWPPITEPIRIVEYIQLTTEDSGLPTWSPDGSKIAFVRSSGRAIETKEAWLPISEVWVMSADGSNAEKLADNGIWPVWSPDGQRIAYVSTIKVGEGELWIVNVNGRGRRKLADIDFKPVQWVLGGQIAFVQQGRAMLIWEDGTNPRSLEINIPTDPIRRGFEFSPDGTRLSLRSVGRLQVMQFQGGQFTTIADVPDQAPGRSSWAFVWSPNGQKLAYIAGQSGSQPELWVINADGTGQLLLLRGQLKVFDYLTWSPDGRYVAFTHSPTGSNIASARQIYLVKATGSQPLNLTPNYEGGASLAWSPDGTRIAFVRVDPADKSTIWVAVLSYNNQSQQTPPVTTDNNPPATPSQPTPEPDNWESLIPSIRTILGPTFPEESIERDVPLTIYKKDDITGDGVPEALVDVGIHGACAYFSTLMRIENDKPVVVQFKQKDGKVSPLIFSYGACTGYGSDIVMLSDKKTIYSGGWMRSMDTPRKLEACDVDTYQWNAQTKIFEFNLVLSNEIKPDYCRKAEAGEAPN